MSEFIGALFALLFIVAVTTLALWGFWLIGPYFKDNYRRTRRRNPW